MASVSFNIAGIMIGGVLFMLVFAAPISRASLVAVLKVTDGSDSTVGATINFVQDGLDVTVAVGVTGLPDGAVVKSATLTIGNGNTINALIGGPITVGADGTAALPTSTIRSTMLSELIGLPASLTATVSGEVATTEIHLVGTVSATA
ncbi:hypothetical protein Dimus_012142 [Dionaea muscipula]